MDTSPSGGKSADGGATASIPAGQNPCLYVGELDKDVSEQELLKMFNAFGTVTTVKIPRDATTRISLGYAYVDFLDTASAYNAMRELTYTSIRGRTCRIMWAKKNPEERNNSDLNLYVRNLPLEMTEREVFLAFGTFGSIQSVKMPKDRDGKRLGCAYVHFDTKRCADTAMAEMNGCEFPSGSGNLIKVEPYKRNTERAQGKAWTNLYVRGLPAAWDEAALTAVFGKFGEITSVALASKTQSAASKVANKTSDAGFVNFREQSSADAAIAALNGAEFDDGPFVQKPEEAAAAASAAGAGASKNQVSGEASAPTAAAPSESAVAAVSPTIDAVAALSSSLEVLAVVETVPAASTEQPTQEAAPADKASEASPPAAAESLVASATDAAPAIVAGDAAGAVSSTPEVQASDTPATSAPSSAEAPVIAPTPAAAPAAAPDAAPAAAPDAAPAAAAPAAAAAAPNAPPAAKRTTKLEVMRHLSDAERLRQKANKLKAFKSADSPNLYVRHLPLNFTEDKLRALFTAHGIVTSCSLVKDAQDKYTGAGFVSFSARAEAETALNALQGHRVDERGAPLLVAWFQNKEVRAARLAAEMSDKRTGGPAAPQRSAGYVPTMPFGFGMPGALPVMPNMYQMFQQMQQMQNPGMQGMQGVMGGADGGAAGGMAFPGAPRPMAPYFAQSPPIMAQPPPQQQQQHQQQQQPHQQPQQGFVAPRGYPGVGQGQMGQQAGGAQGGSTRMMPGGGPQGQGMGGGPGGMMGGGNMGGAQGFGAMRPAGGMGAPGGVGPGPWMNGPPQARPLGGGYQQMQGMGGGGYGPGPGFGYGGQGAPGPMPGQYGGGPQQQQQQQQQQPPPRASAGAQKVIAEARATNDPEKRRNILGSYLYPIVQQSYPELAGKITGMILAQEFNDIVQSLDEIDKKIAEAYDVLEKARTGRGY